MIQSYRQLVVWEKSKRLVVAVYKLTGNFPKEELFGITSQMRRSSISIPSNIAEGRMRGTKKDFLSFLRISYGSGAELETQIEIAKEVFKDKNLDFSQVDPLLEEVMKMLNVMIRRMNPTLSHTSEANEAA